MSTNHARALAWRAALLLGPALAACSEPNADDLFGSTGGGGGAGGGGAGTFVTSTPAATTGGSTTSATSGSAATTGVVTSTSTGPGCDPVTQFTCFDGGCIDGFYVCDGYLDCLDASDEAPVNPQCATTSTTATSTSTGGPAGWTCTASFYGSGDGCDCGCGVIDADCPNGSVEACEYCNSTGSCAVFDCDAIDHDQNWLCKD